MSRFELFEKYVIQILGQRAPSVSEMQAQIIIDHLAALASIDRQHSTGASISPTPHNLKEISAILEQLRIFSPGLDLVLAESVVLHFPY